MRPSLRLNKPQRVLLVIAPSMHACVKTAKAFGIEPGLSETLRCVTEAYKLRGWSVGTPFIAQDRVSWGATKAGDDLDRALDLLVGMGRLRIANPKDLQAAGAGLFDDVKVAAE